MAGFVTGELGQKSFFESMAKNANQQNLRLQTGLIFLGDDWRISLPVQLQYQTRKDTIKVALFSAGANLTNQLTHQLTTESSLQVSQVNYQPSNYKVYNTNNFNLGWQFTYRPIEVVKFNLGVVIGLEQEQKSSHKENGRNFHGLQSSIGWVATNQLRLDINAKYLTATHRAADPALGSLIKREDDQLSLGFRASQKLGRGWQADLTLQNNDISSNYNLYTYQRTSYSLGIRKEW